MQPLVPDISKTNFMDQGDPTPEIEKTMSKNMALTSSWASGAIRTVNSLQRIEDKQIRDLYGITQSGIQLHTWNQARIESKKVDEEYIKRFTDAEYRWKQDAVTEGLGNRIDATEDAQIKTVERARVEANQEGIPVDAEEYDEALKSAKPFAEDIESIQELRSQLGAIFAEAQGTLEFKAADGTWKTLNQAGLSREDYQRGMRAYRLVIWQKAQELTNNQLVLRRELLPYMTKFDRDQSALRNYRVAEILKADQKIAAETKLSNEVNANGYQAFEREYNIELARFPLTEKGKPNYAAASVSMTDRTIDLINKGRITTGAAEEILAGYPAFGPGGHPGQDKNQSKTWEDLNPVQALRLRSAIERKKSADFDAKKQTQNNKTRAYYWQWYDNLDKMPGTMDDKLNQFATGFREEFGPDVPFPEEYQTLLTNAEGDSEENLKAFKRAIAVGDGLNLKKARLYHASITHPDHIEEADQLLEQVRLGNMDTGDRDKFIWGALNKHMKLQLPTGVIGDPRHQFSVENLTEIYNKAYLDAIGRAQPISVARGAGVAAVNDAIKNDPTIGVFKNGKWDDDAEDGLNQSLAAVRKDNSLIYKKEFLPGEKTALEDLEKWYATGGEPIPYFRELAKAVPGKNWKQVADMRYKATGMGEPKQTDLEVEVSKLSPEHQTLLNQNNPSTTLRVLLENSQFAETFNLDTQENPDFNYVRKEGGQGPVETEKPLTQMTIGEVLELAESGHFDFGAAGFYPKDLGDALAGIDQDWDLDTVFDEQFQLKLILGLLRTKANRQNASAGVDTAWMSLTNINEEAALAYQEQTGITDPYLQLNTMPKTVAMAAVDLHLPDMA